TQRAQAARALSLMGPFVELFEPTRIQPYVSAAARNASTPADPRAPGSKRQRMGHFLPGSNADGR
ncbi:MAG: hypothetical protein MUQ00_04265, partial [Candidatus Aminicenantes bacterium]|nr:hypothetical protein [Candidatus Aminicenantes bacterium]